MKSINIFNLIFLTLILLHLQPAYAQQIPHLMKNGNATQLIVDGKPFLILGGELHNSSSSDLSYLSSLWEPIKQLNLNTALVAVSWELVEPQEGKFNFELVDGILEGARKNDLKVILLWFGSWKNGLSHYVPEWVKNDTKRFPRIVLENGKSTETITALSTEAAKADAKAFAALMKHVKKADETQRTVVMVQVENEVGVIGGTRDHSKFANGEFAKPVPTELMENLNKNKDILQPQLKKLLSNGKKSGTWSEVFGSGKEADEAFMAWNYAKYINQVAGAGKAAYRLPMFVNAWIVQPQDKKPGDYPSGGPQSHVHDIWRAAAPTIDLFCPDIYLPDFVDITSMYKHSWNPLFIPESFAGIDGAANAFYAIGQHQALGYSPFGIDNKEEKPSETPVAKAYKVLEQLTPEIVKGQSENAIAGFKLTKKDSIQTVELGGYTVTVALRKNWSGVPQASRGYGLVIHTDADHFTVSGSNIDVTFVPVSEGPKMAGLSYVREGTFEKGAWKPGRYLNGDNIMISYKLAEEAAENRTGTGARIHEDPAILKLKLYRYE